MKVNFIPSPVIANTEVAHGIFELILDASPIARRAKPGQFVNLLLPASPLQEEGKGRGKFWKYKIHENYIPGALSKDLIEPYPLLKRPFSIHDIYGDRTLSLLIKIVGEGTRQLSFLEKGGEVMLLGPLGNGFYTEADKRISVLVGGGMGIAPLFSLARSLSRKGKNIFLFLGFYDKMRIPKRVLELSTEPSAFPCDLKITTEKREEGFFHGKVTDLLGQFFNMNRSKEKMEIFSCGPWDMMKEASKWGKEFSIPHQVLLEERMGCGIGACMGCVCKTKEENIFSYKRTCVDGPVFRAENIFY